MQKAKIPRPKAPAETGGRKEMTELWSTQVPLSQQCMTPELIAETQAVWSPCYGYVLTVAEAVEILGNVKAYIEVMLLAEDLINEEKVRSP